MSVRIVMLGAALLLIASCSADRSTPSSTATTASPASETANPPAGGDAPSSAPAVATPGEDRETDGEVDEHADADDDVDESHEHDDVDEADEHADDDVDESHERDGAAGHEGSRAMTAGGHPGGREDGPPKDLRVLPRTWTHEQVVSYMKDISHGLGAKCTFCHVRGSFAADTEHKTTARKMITMQQRINREYFGGKPEVTCFTCHKGEKHPPRPAE